MPKVPEYFIVGSEAGTGSIEMLKDSDPFEVVGIRLVLKPMDLDDDDVFTIVGIAGREDMEVLIAKLQEESVKVPYMRDQVPAKTDKEGNDRNA